MPVGCVLREIFLCEWEMYSKFMAIKLYLYPEVSVIFDVWWEALRKIDGCITVMNHLLSLPR